MPRTERPNFRRTLSSHALWRFGQHNAADFAVFLLTLGAIVLIVVCAIFRLGHAYVGVDDANIAMVYARNVAAGHGFVYHVGGERVEGFTSFLYVLVMAIVFAAFPRPELCLLGVNVLLASLAVFLPLTSLRGFLAAGRPESTWLRPVQLVMVTWAVVSPAFIIWTTVSLMETGLWAFMWSYSVTVVLWAVGNPEPSRSRLAVMATLAFLLPLTRPEGTAAAPVFILAYALARRLHTPTWRGLTPSLLVPGLAWLLATASITAFRIEYFGFPLPNTYYAKVSPDVLYRLRVGAQYLADFVLARPLMMSAVLGAIAVGLVLNAKLALAILGRGRVVTEPDSSKSVARVAHFTVGLLSVTGLLLPVYGGGDHFAGFRFYQPVWPTLILPVLLLGLDVSFAWHGAVRYLDHHRLAWIVAIASLPMLALLTAAPWPARPQSAPLLDEFEIAEAGRRLGVVLNRLFPAAPPPVGVTAAGGVQYSYQGPIFDMLGLNHVRMGHSPGERRGIRNHAAFDKDVFWSVAPPVVWPALCPGPIDEDLVRREFSKLSDDFMQRLFRDPAFENHYLLVTVQGSGDHAVFDRSPFFFMPLWFPHAKLPADDYRDATVIAYVARSIVHRLASQGWRIRVLSQRGDATDTEGAAHADACTPPAPRSGQGK